MNKALRERIAGIQNELDGIKSELWSWEDDEDLDEIASLKNQKSRLREHIKNALLTFCQGSCPTCGDNYPEEPYVDGCSTCIWVSDAQRLLDETEAKP